MIDFFKKLFCLNHKYDAAQIIKATYKVNATVTLDCPITLLVCQKCGKRKVINDYSWLDTQRTLKFLKLWEKNHLDEIKQEFLTNERFNSNSPSRLS